MPLTNFWATFLVFYKLFYNKVIDKKNASGEELLVNNENGKNKTKTFSVWNYKSVYFFR